MDLLKEIKDLEDKYSNHQISLDVVVQRCEQLIESNRQSIPASVFLRTMNCLYLLEDLNALSFDEGRSINEKEFSYAVAQLVKLSDILRESKA